MKSVPWRPLILAFVFTVRATAAHTQPYTVVELGPPAGHDSAFASDINNRLQIVGSAGDQVILWDGIGVPPRAVGVTTVATPLKINDRGSIAGLHSVPGRQFQPFVLAGGVLYHPTFPADEAFPQPTVLLENDVLILNSNTRSWATFNETAYDLTALTGARIFAANSAGLIGGQVGDEPYLRYPDGRVVIPWSGPSSGVTRIGPAGHFAGTSPPGLLYYGLPDGSITTIAIPSLFPFTGLQITDINGRGDLVGNRSFTFRFISENTPYLYKNTRLIDLNTATMNYPLRLFVASAINDAGYIVASAIVSASGSLVVTRPVVLIPAPPRAPGSLVFSLSGRTVTLSWQEPIGALDYVIEVGSASGASNLLVAPIGPDTRLTAMAPPGRYFVRVRARNDVGLSDASSEVMIDVP